jgi:hypothetical protein
MPQQSGVAAVVCHGHRGVGAGALSVSGPLRAGLASDAAERRGHLRDAPGVGMVHSTDLTGFALSAGGDVAEDRDREWFMVTAVRAVGGLGLLVGLASLVFTGLSMAAFCLVAGAAGLLTAAIPLSSYRRDASGKLAGLPANLLLAVVAGAAGCFFVLSLVSTGVHVFDNNDYLKRHGTPTIATVPDRSVCKDTRRPDGHVYTCGAGWIFNGEQGSYVYDLVLSAEEFRTVKDDSTFPAHIADTTAYTDGAAESVSSAVDIGRVPWWMVFVTAIAAAAAIATANAASRKVDRAIR